MTKEEFISEIELQKERGSKLLEQVQQMHVGRNNYRDGLSTFGPAPMYYTPKEELEPVQNEYEAWKCYVHDFLLSVLANDDDIITEWNKSLQEPYRHDVSDREWYTKEIKKALGKLDSFAQRIGFRFQDTANKEVSTQQGESICNKCPVIFISHSSADEAIISKFIEIVLRLGLNINKEDIAFTSNEVYGVEAGENIVEYIRKNIKHPSVVLIMISDNYKKSEVCLNEMGAAWAHGKKCISVVLPNTGFDKLGWLSSFEKAERIDDKKQLFALCGKIAELLNINMAKQLPAIGSYIDEFLGLIGNGGLVVKTSGAKTLEVGDVDAIVMKSINKLGEFTFKELLAETGFQDSAYLLQKLNALVSHGDLDRFGPATDKRYRIKVSR